MTPKISYDLSKAVDDSNGCVRVEGDSGTYILMSIQVYRDVMGVGTDQELEESLAAIDEAVKDIKEGRTVPMDQVFRELDEQYGDRVHPPGAAGHQRHCRVHC